MPWIIENKTKTKYLSISPRCKMKAVKSKSKATRFITQDIALMMLSQYGGREDFDCDSVVFTIK